MLAARYGINQKTVAKWKKQLFGYRSTDRTKSGDVDRPVD